MEMRSYVTSELPMFVSDISLAAVQVSPIIQGTMLVVGVAA